MRALKLILAVVCGAAVLVLGVLAFAVGTETGTRLLLQRAALYLPQGVQIGAVEGRLADRLVLHELSVETDGWRVEVGRVQWHWSLTGLASRRLIVESLQADGVGVSRLAVTEPLPEPTPPAEPLALPARIELPLAVTVRQAVVHDLAISVFPGEAPLLFDGVEAAATLRGSQLDVERLEARSSLLDLDAAARMTLAEEYPLEAELAWRLRWEEFPELHATTRVGGSLHELEVEQTVGAPYGVTAQATVTEPLAAPGGMRLAVSAQLTELELGALHANLAPLSLSGALDIGGTLDALDIVGGLAASGLEQGLVEAEVEAMLEPQGVVVRHLLLTQPTHAGRLQAEGHVGFEAGIAADLNIAWERLQWPLEGEATVGSPRGEGRFTGPPEDYRLQLAGEVIVPEQPALTLELTGEGSLEAIAFELSAATPYGRAGGHAEVAWAPALEARLELTGENFDAGLLAPDWPGRVGFELSADAHAEADVIEVRVARLRAGGELRAQPLALEGSGAYRYDADASTAHAVDIAGLRLTLGSTALEIDGRIADSAELSWRLESADITAVLPEAHGSLSAAGSINGTWPLPRIELELQGSALGYAEERLEHVEIVAYLDPTAQTASSVNLLARDGLVGGLVLERLAFTGAGTPAEHRLDAELASDRGAVGLTVDGGLAEPLDADTTWTFRAITATLAPPELAPWSLREPAGGQLARAGASVDRHCWISGEAELCLAASQLDEITALDFELNGLGLAYLAPLLPPGYALDGDVAAIGSLRQREGQALTGELEVTTGAGAIAVAVDGEGTSPSGIERLRLQPSRARLMLSPEETAAELDLQLEHGHLRLEANLPGAANGADPLTERPLSGLLSVEVPDLAFVADFLADLSETSGAIGGDLVLDGTLGDPALIGRIALRDGRARAPAVGVTVTGLSLVLEGHGGDTVTLSAAASSGAGAVELSGELALLNEVPSADLRIRGESFTISDTREVRLDVTPDLQILADGQRIDVTGEVRVPRAVLMPGAGGTAAAVRASPDQILLETETENDERIAAEPFRDLHARVRIILGEAVTFDGYGLTARLTGNVLAVQTPGAPTTATGELNILDGEYRAYGQGLVIETGNVYFAGGPLTDPALDVRAVRRPQPGITVGAHVVGPLREPQFNLFSEPPMTQQEQLSFLVLGRSLSEAQSGERSALSHAVLSMGLRGGDFLARNIGDRIGVDQLTIETGSGEAGAASDVTQAALVAGKYLSPRLYVSYGIGLFDTVNVLRIQYTIADRWRIVTQSSSEASGADVLYTRERGR